MNGVQGTPTCVVGNRQGNCLISAGKEEEPRGNERGGREGRIDGDRGHKTVGTKGERRMAQWAQDRWHDGHKIGGTMSTTSVARWAQHRWHNGHKIGGTMGTRSIGGTMSTTSVARWAQHCWHNGHKIGGTMGTRLMARCAKGRWS
eukprot:365092-Chlamydomonas_euryale.AAC.4